MEVFPECSCCVCQSGNTAMTQTVFPAGRKFVQYTFTMGQGPLVDVRDPAVAEAAPALSPQDSESLGEHRPTP